MKALYCLFYGHVWFATVVTHHDAVERLDEVEHYRGVWHERICTRCQFNEAVYQKSVNRWNIVLDETVEPTPTEHFPYPGHWGGHSV